MTLDEFGRDGDLELMKLYSDNLLVIESTSAEDILKDVYGGPVGDSRSAFYYLGIALKKISVYIKKQIKKLVDYVKEQVSDTIMRATMKKTIAMLNNLPDGKNTVDYVDVWKLEKLSDALTKAIDTFLRDWSKVVERDPHTYFLQTQRFVTKYSAVTTRLINQIEQVKTKQVPVNAKKLSRWLQDNISGRSCAIRSMKETQKIIENAEKYISAIEVKLHNYAEANGYREELSGVTDFVFNNVHYVKKNADWILLSTISLLGAHSNTVVKLAGKSMIAMNEENPEDFPLTDETIQAFDNMAVNVQAVSPWVSQISGRLANIARKQKDHRNRI